MRHELKILPQYFCRVADGTKTFEVRENDRGFQPNDEVVLKEWDPSEITRREEWPMGIDEWKEPRGFTGENLKFKIGYVLPLDDKRVVFSLLPLKESA